MTDLKAPKEGAANAGGWKTCSRGHKFRGPSPCPVCWPGGRKRAEAVKAEKSAKAKA